MGMNHETRRLALGGQGHSAEELVFGCKLFGLILLAASIFLLACAIISLYGRHHGF